MKRLYYIFSAAFLALAGCNKQLDELPDNQVRIDSPEKVRKLLVNAYPLASGFILNEFSSDNIGDGGSLLKYESRFNGEIANWETINEYSNSEGLYYVWQYHYQAINHANTALEAIDKLGNTPELQAARGEALVARAYAHFELVNLFGKPYNRSTSASDPGIPYMLAIIAWLSIILIKKQLMLLPLVFISITKSGKKLWMQPMRYLLPMIEPLKIY